MKLNTKNIEGYEKDDPGGKGCRARRVRAGHDGLDCQGDV